MGAVEPGNLAPPVRLNRKVRWTLNRLRCMTPAEVGHRVVQAATLRAERWGLAPVSVPAPDLTRSALPWIDAAAPVDRARYVAAAERVLAGRYDVFALEDVALGSPPRWNRDPKTGTEAPLTFGMSLDYRDAGKVGDCKYLWEPNRHLHLVTLAQAHALTGDAKFGAALRAHLESWWRACPFRRGANWASALEAAIRLIHWALAWQLVGGVASPLFAGREGAAFRARWLESVYQHAEFVGGHLSLHSSANNHLVGEAAGLYTAAMAWPHWPRAREWAAGSRAILEREAMLQNAADGVNLEQAISYQQFTFELLLLAMLAGRANGEPFPAAVASRLEAMLEFLASVIDASGHIPMIGDADDALVARLDPGPGYCRFRSSLATGAILFGRPEFKKKAGALDEKTRWLLGAGTDADYARIDEASAALPVRRAFDDGGYYILGQDFETPREVRLVVDAGPLGYRSIAAHGHADALAFTLCVAGREFLVDPGTFAYHTEPQWRAYFRGTSAHNTLRVDGCDQSEPGGNFMWLAKAKASCTRFEVSEAEDLFEGWHDGYRRLADPVTHRRRIRLDKARRVIEVHDTLAMKGAHDVELFFHFAECCRLVPVAGGFSARNGEGAVTLRLPRVPGAGASLAAGSVDPPLGWISRRFDRREPSPTVRWRARVQGATVLNTRIEY